MNKKVLVFTKIDGWDNMHPTIKKRVNKKEWENSYPNQNSGIVRFESNNNQAKLVPVDLNQNPITDEDGIFLVYDELYDVNPTEFESLKNQCSGDTLYILAHKNGKYPKGGFANWGCKGYKEESHLPDSGNSYSKFFDILTDSEDSEGKKMNRIINQVFRPVLDAALGLLHLCMADRTFDPSTSPLANSFPENSVAGKALNTYNKSKKSDGDLEALRNQLLDYALAQN